MQTIYLIDPDTREFIGEAPHPLDPVETARAGQPVYARLDPTHATTDAPADIPPGMRALRAQDRWDIVPKPGTPLTAQEMLASIQAQLVQLASTRRQELEAGGIELAHGVRVHTTKADQDRITSVLVNADPAGIEAVDFKAASGWVSLSLDELRDIARAVARHVQACFTAERAHHEAIAALTTVAQARVYDLATGWPSSSAATAGSPI